ncbi:hypothetical protein [Clavibacter michiganensis]|uniref:hypothetical protein n=1 Tax=Clavibacter michiganensis TaxID=28447 RepID=UPI000B3A8FD5|nr:hypothetical protein [Clavibacter michiganensis]MDO4031528.1 hypothetical protein [Clavibacter michiganensis]MDO4081189.1 hypothetical protein [Clavibacter michiganensis]MDO4086495.1 hypothetical protein [Clavibacter michiganensis]MDO4097012.1 hypothetical protein [Clavibacter michiganensis]MWJ03852.1 hypothetical protein [Clavibacter michiganensis subsp. michiganensis]
MPVRLPAPTRPRIARTIPTAAAAGLAVAMLLAGCSNPAPLQPTTPDPSASAGGGGEAQGGGSGSGPTSSPTPAPPKGTPVSTTCAQLLPDLAEFGTGFASEALPADTSTDGLRADVLTMQGIACAFRSSDGTAVEIDVAQPVAAELQSRRDAAILLADPIAGYPSGVEAYFELEDAIGVSTIYSSKHMIVMRSAAFYEPGDHADLGNAVLKTVGG